MREPLLFHRLRQLQVVIDGPIQAPRQEATDLDHARKGDEDAFLRIYYAHRAPLFAFAWRMTGSIEAAEDVLQECFLVLMRSTTFDARQGTLQSWLFGTARNLILRSLRNSERDFDDGPEDAAVNTADTLGDLLALERAELVQHAVAALPPLQREAILLFEFEDMSLEDIAVVTGAQVGAVKARLQRARESLRKQLGALLSPNKQRSSG